MFLGIDISKRDFHVALLIADKFKTKVFPNQAQGFADLARWLTKLNAVRVHACIEATGVYGEALAEYLFDAGHTVSVVNPARIRGFAQSLLTRAKTDKVDARIIAQFCQAMNPASFTPLPKEVRLLQSWLRRLDALLVMHTQEHNRLDVAPVSVQASISEHLAFLDREIAAVRQAISDHIDHFPDLKQQADLLESIPGIGEATAAWLLGELDLKRFDSARQSAAQCGLTPKPRQSGTLNAPAHLAKTGSARMRKALYMPALAAIRFNPVIRAFALRLEKRGKHKMVIIAAVMRKLIHIAYGVLKSGQPFNPRLVKA